jgi:hypothetical protein
VQLFGDSKIDQLFLVLMDKFLFLLTLLLKIAGLTFFDTFFMIGEDLIVIFVIIVCFGLCSRSLLDCGFRRDLVDECTELLLIDFQYGFGDHGGLARVICGKLVEILCVLRIHKIINIIAHPTLLINFPINNNTQCSNIGNVSLCKEVFKSSAEVIHKYIFEYEVCDSYHREDIELNKGSLGECDEIEKDTDGVGNK